MWLPEVSQFGDDLIGQGNHNQTSLAKTYKQQKRISQNSADLYQHFWALMRAASWFTSDTFCYWGKRESPRVSFVVVSLHDLIPSTEPRVLILSGRRLGSPHRNFVRTQTLKSSRRCWGGIKEERYKQCLCPFWVRPSGLGQNVSRKVDRKQLQQEVGNMLLEDREEASL